MDEYISREEAIKELREVYEYEYPTASGDFDEYASHDVPNVLRNMSVADVQPVNQWISVDDKLPDSDTTVLVWYTADSLFGRFGDYGVTHYRESSGWSKASLIGDDQAIFYWMPLPEPPQD